MSEPVLGLREASPCDAGFFMLGPVEAIPLGQGRAYVVAGRTIAVFRLRDGRVFASENRCPHRGGPLAEGVVGDAKVICPLHSRKYDLTSGRCVNETGAVGVYDVRIVHDQIWLSIEAGAPHAE